MKIKWFGTASIMIYSGNKKILFDPFYPRNKKINIDCSEFLNADYIFITHPHFDHLYDVKDIMINSNATLFGTDTTIKQLKSPKIDNNKLNTINYKENIQLGEISINAHKSKHIKNNLGIILKTIFNYRIFTKLKQLIWIGKTHKSFPMNNEIVGYEVRAENKCILIFGSGNIDEKIEYPKDIDLLIFAYQGRTGLAKYTINILKRLKPKYVMLDHFDDTFPPLTSNINPNKLYKLLQKENLDIGIFKANYNSEIEI